MWSAYGHADHRVAFRIEGHHANVGSVSRLAGPRRRVALLGLGVQRMPGPQDRLVAAGVALLRADAPDVAMPMIDVVPTHELGRPGPGVVDAGEARGRELGPVLGRAEHRLRIGVGVSSQLHRKGTLSDDLFV